MRFKGRFRRPDVADEYAVVLDYMPMGNPYDRHSFHRSTPVAQGIGTKYFTLVEIVPSRGRSLMIGERIPISLYTKDSEVKVFDRLAYEDLTSVARTNLGKVIHSIVVEKERVFVEFFNVAEAINIRLHSLELLPSIGKKTLTLILEERRRKNFESFEDLKRRAKVSDPVKIIVERLILELQHSEKYYIFVEPFPPAPGHVFLNYLQLLYERLDYVEPW